MNYEPTKLAYLAGIIDGEGTIYIGRVTRKRITGIKVHYATIMQVSNTDKCLIDWLYNNFGGSTSQYTPGQLPKNSRMHVYSWKITHQLEEICKALLPYLVTKKKQAEIMIQMRKTYNPIFSNRSKISKALPIETMELRERLCKELKSLHIRNLKNKPCAVSPT